MRRLVHAMANHGPLGALLRAFNRLRGAPEAEPLAVNARDTQPHPFDLAHSVDTSGYIPGEAIEACLAQATGASFFNTAYYAISPSTLAQALSLLPEPPESFTFVDLGCGKGRALLVAARFHFARLTGVELSPELSAIARANAAVSADAQIAVHTADAASFEFPPEPLVVFLYHPFLRPLLRRVLRNLKRQLRHTPRTLYLLYANPGYQRTIAQFHWLHEIWDLSIPLSAADAAADRHGITHERYTLYKSNL